MTLYDLSQGDRGIITKVMGRGAFRKRILEMGFIPGKQVRVVKKAPLRDPVEYTILGYNVSLRNSEAQLIEVLTPEEAVVSNGENAQTATVPDELFLNKTAKEKGKRIDIALVGNPNCGKTTLFNMASGSRERVGNYGGVTVEAKKARIRHKGYIINMIDLPGTYSLSAYSPEELFVREYIFKHHPDIVINVIDASNLERNLYLTSQLIDMDIRVVIAMNMYDEFQKSGSSLDHERLGKLLGIPIIPTISPKGKGIEALLDKTIDVYEDRDETTRHIHISYGSHLEEAIQRVQDKIKQASNYFLTDSISSRFLSIKLIEKDADASSRIQPCPNHLDIVAQVREEIRFIEEDMKSDSESLITDAKYGFIEGALKETLQSSPVEERKKSEVIDTFFTHKLWGIPVFVLFMWLAFYITFKIGEYPMGWIETLVGKVSELTDTLMPPGPLKDLLIQGVIGGVGGVIVFLPNILLLFLFISLMEDTGYLARAVFIMDKAMHRIGLHGKSFIPLLMGFGCNVPAIMSTRIIESRRDKMVTILINPFMSCSARLPVYILFISAFFVVYQGTILFLMYFAGILIAIMSALLFNKTLFKKADVPFVMELPPYRVPTLRSLLRHMWTRAQQYLRKIGVIILTASVIIWALGYYPRNRELENAYRTEVEKRAAMHVEQGTTLDEKAYFPAGLDDHQLELYYLQAAQEYSLIGRIGKFIEPVMDPLGFNWKMTVAILTGIAGKEIVVGTLGVLHHTDPGNKTESASLIVRLKEEIEDNSRLNVSHPYQSKLIAISFMLFILIYFPCIAVIATIRKETGHWKWAIFTILYTTGLAWLISFLTYQGGLLIVRLF
ncbi:MAG TPA: ferrous iron transport protein B [Bacteroidales bacterium]|nr:ferrous iron transport protein B [Bacteroidales bacterium]HSA42652.1 ferrous iron transport protein B [Bacteroidales bacterium]